MAEKVLSKRWLKRRRVELYMLRSPGRWGIASMRFMGFPAMRVPHSREMAAASGLERCAALPRSDPLNTSWGTGELIRHALDAGVEAYHY